LLDGTKAYVHAVIDNFSRRILAWTVASRLDPMNTHDVLTRAAGHLVASTNVFMDSGVENLNGDVDRLFDGGALQRVIAQIDVSFSNSLIEAWWRCLKHRWLFLHPLDNLATVQRLVELYVTEHLGRAPARCRRLGELRCPTSFETASVPQSEPWSVARRPPVTPDMGISSIRRCQSSQ
jgi:putative transposase